MRWSLISDNNHSDDYYHPADDDGDDNEIDATLVDERWRGAVSTSGLSAVSPVHSFGRFWLAIAAVGGNDDKDDRDDLGHKETILIMNLWQSRGGYIMQCIYVYRK